MTVKKGLPLWPTRTGETTAVGMQPYCRELDPGKERKEFGSMCLNHDVSREGNRDRPIQRLNLSENLCCIRFSVGLQNRSMTLADYHDMQISMGAPMEEPGLDFTSHNRARFAELIAEANRLQAEYEA